MLKKKELKKNEKRMKLKKEWNLLNEKRMKFIK